MHASLRERAVYVKEVGHNFEFRIQFTKLDKGDGKSAHDEQPLVCSIVLKWYSFLLVWIFNYLNLCNETYFVAE